MPQRRLSLRNALIVILGLYAVGNALWLWENQLRSVGTAYHARHFMRAAQFHVLLADFSPISKIYGAMHPDRFYPAPLHSFTVALGILFIGKFLPLVTWGINLFYFSIALVSLLLLASELDLPPPVALWAVVLFASYPAIYGLSRLYGAFDFQITALMPLAVLSLIQTKGFTSRRKCMILAGVMTVSLLIKDTFAGYFGPVFALAVFDALRKKRDPARIKNIALLLGLVAAGIAVYYAHPVVIYKELTELMREPGGSRYFLDDWQAYTLGVPNGLMSPLFFFLFIGALAWAWRKKRSHPKHRLLLTWALAPWVIIILMRHYKQPCYFVPILPAAALLSAMALHSLAPRYRRPLMGLLLATGIAQFAIFSFDLGARFVPTAYFRLDPTILFHKNFPVEIDTYSDIAGKISKINAQERRDNRILILQALGQQTTVTFYHFFNWLYGLELEPAGGVAEMFGGDFLEEKFDKILLPLPPGYTLEDYVHEIHQDSVELARRNWLDDTAKTLAKTQPEQFAKKLRLFLEPFSEKRQLQRDGENIIWLLSKPRS